MRLIPRHTILISWGAMGFLFFARPFMNMLLDPLSNSTRCASDGDMYNGMSTLGDYGYSEGRGPTGRPMCVYTFQIASYAPG